jgi:hypothetical protein
MSYRYNAGIMHHHTAFRFRALVHATGYEKMKPENVISFNKKL